MTACRLFRVVRGIDEDPVVVRPLPKSMGAHKSFTATASYAVVRDFLIILANEIETRVVNDEAENNRRPQTITLHVRSRRGTSSKSSAFPSAKTQPFVAVGRVEGTAFSRVPSLTPMPRVLQSHSCRRRVIVRAVY